MEQREKFDLVIRLGETLLYNGGEIFRTNEVMRLAAGQFGLEEFNAFTIANGVFVSALVDGKQHSCQVRYVPLGAVHLGRVEAINDLSRHIAAGEISPEEVKVQVEQIRTIQETRDRSQIFASGVGSGCFCFLFGGSWWDSLLAFLAGLLLYFFLLKVCSRFSVHKVMSNLLSSGLVTLFCCVAFRLIPGLHLDKMIIGSIFPLVPGVPLSMAARNFIENDYIAGLVRMTDAVLVAGCIAVGVGCVLLTWNSVFGGILL